MIRIKKNITAQDQQISLETYLEKDFSVTLVNNQQKILFLQDKVQTYIVDEKQRKLTALPNGEEHLAQIKNLLGEVWLDEAYHINSTYKQRSYYIANNFIIASAKLTGEVAVCVDDRLTATTNHIQNAYDSQRQFFHLPLAENETLSYIKTVMELNGQKIVSKMEIVSIEDAIMPKLFRDYANYTQNAKAA